METKKNKGKQPKVTEPEPIEEPEDGGNPPKRIIDSRLYEESPPEDCGAKEFQHCEWFIDANWKVVISPPPGRKSGKTKAYVLKLKEEINKRTLGKGDFKEEVFIINGFFFETNQYKYWDKQGIWKEHADIKHAFRKKNISADAKKSKTINKVNLINHKCRGDKSPHQSKVSKG